MNKYIIYIATVLLAACGGAGQTKEEPANNPNKTSVTITRAQANNAGIQTGKAQIMGLSSILKVNGVIDVPPQNMVSVSVPMGGYLKSTKLLPGMHIGKGDVIAVMEDQQYIQLQQDYLNAQARFKFLEAEYFRQKDLNASKASSDKVFQQAEADYKSQKILIKSLYEKLKLISINPDNLNENTLSRGINVYSPIDGFVSKVNVNIGKYVNPADVLFELVNPTDIHLNLTVFEKDLDKFSIGQKVFAYTNNADKKYACEVILIGKSLSAERNVEVHCHFEEYDKSLIPGMYMNADVEVKKADALALPNDAIVEFENKQYVFVQKSTYQFDLLEVKTGSSEGGFTEIVPVDKTQNISAYTCATQGAYQLLLILKNKSE
ncbi:MAG: efflux RND transporter periplasmic adaptor subunit [Sphingobacteriales bacterium JAD_PAG50586_3]|nr:MAG: efflux RND transporter periplasmic adaptor subunit [Sphingobacteriales bacterium JAD_PAG50586_3]